MTDAVWAHESGTSLPYCLEEITRLRAEVERVLDQLRYIDSICYLNGVKVSVSKLVEEAAKRQETLDKITLLRAEMESLKRGHDAIHLQASNECARANAAEVARDEALAILRKQDDAVLAYDAMKHEAEANAELVGEQTAKLASALADKQEALARVAKLEQEPVITLPSGQNVGIGELVELYLESLDRLQRAEAAVKAAKVFVKDKDYGGCGISYRLLDELRKALAAWEEGK